MVLGEDVTLNPLGSIRDTNILLHNCSQNVESWILYSL